MDIFGFKLTQVNGCFKLKYMTLLMVLIPCAWTQENIPSFNVTCDSSGLYVEIAFSKPFNGIVYVKGYRFDPLCTTIKSSALDGFLALPLTACGNFIQGANHLSITNTVAIQQHPLIRTDKDFEKSIECSMPNPFVNSWNSPLLLDQIYEANSLPMLDSSYLQFGADIFIENSAAIFGNGSDRLSIFQLLNGEIYEDFGIKSCIAHNPEILSGNTSVLLINNTEECFTTDSENYTLKFVKTDKGIMVNVEMENLKIEVSDSIFLSCEIVLCKTKCRCSEIDQQQKENSTPVISHKLTKRSIDPSSEIFSLKQYEARTRYLKSTVKALMDKIAEQRNRKDKSKIRKRLMRLDDSSSLPETNSLPSHVMVPATEIFSPELVSSEIYNIEPHLVDIYQDYNHKESTLVYSDDESHQDFDHGESHQDYDPGESHQDYDPDESHQDYDPDESHQDYDPDESLQDYDPDESHQGYDHGESHQDNDPDESSTKLSTVDSSTIDVKLPKQFKDNGSEISEEFQVKRARVLNEIVISSVNETTKSITVNTTSLVFPPIIEIASGHNGSCVPRLRFVVVLVVMGFLIGCLLLVSCGMALYIRKEKKRNKLNDFLLYSIGF